MLLQAALLRIGKLEARVTSIENGIAGSRRKRGPEAVDLARQLGLPGELFWEPGYTSERRELAFALRTHDWAARDIAGVLGCTERTVERYFSCRDKKAGAR